jgi:hypothetical protein
LRTECNREMDEIPNQVLIGLAELGSLSEADNAKRDQVLARLRPFDRCGRTHANAWISAACKLTQEQLEAVIRGLVLAEASLPGWNGGSVSGIIWTFQAYQKRVPENADQLANWILQTSTNHYVPYGINRGGTKSVLEFEAYRKVKELRRTESKKHAEAERHRKKVRESVTRRLEHEATIFQKAKAQARQKLIAQLLECSITERLEHIAWDDEHDLTFYPNSFADVTLAELNSLDEVSLERLVLKLKARQKGCWAALFSKVGK